MTTTLGTRVAGAVSNRAVGTGRGASAQVGARVDPASAMESLAAATPCYIAARLEGWKIAPLTKSCQAPSLLSCGIELGNRRSPNPVILVIPLVSKRHVLCHL